MLCVWLVLILLKIKEVDLKKVCIVIPTYNEIENIKEIISKDFDINPDVSILVVDDNSLDGTGALVDNLIKDKVFGDRLHILHRSGKLGLGTAYIQGFQWAMENGFDIFISQDADFSHNPIYIKDMLDVIKNVEVKAISHITGGGFYENIPRMLPADKKAVIKKGSWKILPIFEVIAETGNIPEKDMFGTYNMGVGMIFAVDAKDVDKAMEILKSHGEDAYVIGTVADGDNGVEIC